MKQIRWIRKSHLFRADELICSRCGASFGRPGQICPNCRAEMGKPGYAPSSVDEAEGLSAILDDGR